MKILQISDIHIHNNQKHDVYRIQFQKLYDKLNEEKPDLIVIVGDLFNDFISISNEAKQLAGEFLNNLSSIARIIIVPGNHDIRKKSLNRANSVETIVNLIQNPKITYFGQSGFFDDPDYPIVWVNYSHLEKGIFPWRDIKHTKDGNKVYISLYHDPIFGCNMPNGMSMESKNMIKLADFKKNDLNLFGDIHLRQYFNDTTAYAGSIIQQNFGEYVENHGGIIWEVDGKNISHRDLDIPNEYTKITFNIKEGFDYDNLNFDHPLATSKSEFRVIWNDYSVNINLENETKIRQHIKDKWGVEIVKFEKHRIFTNILSSQKLTEALNINDKTVQQEIFKEYLKLNKYSDDFIDEILAIDDIVDSRLELSKVFSGIVWNIEKFWVDNFKSYDKFNIDWNDIHGILQIHGINQQGKTTVLDAICYIAHGTTLATNKLGGGQREKFGDNRYINNKRKVNYCSGGIVINADGEKYTILRKTERSLGKGSKITSVSTNLEYYLGEEIKEENKLVGEIRNKTQEKINAILGDFEDFIRLTLTNSENLNDLISMDRATFIDSVIRDAGYDIFEKKLEAFKEYKKELNQTRVELNLIQSEQELKDKREIVNNHKVEYDEAREEWKKLEENIDDINKLRDIELKKLHQIDKEIAEIDVDLINKRLEEYAEAINTNLTQQKINAEKQKGLKQEYDAETLEKYLKEIKKLDDDNLNHKLKISQLEGNIEKEKTNKLRVDDKVKMLRQKEIDSQKSNLILIQNDLDKINSELENTIKEKIRDYNDIIKDEEFEVRTIEQELKNIKEKGINIKAQIKRIEEEKVCPTCNREYDQEHINKKVSELNDEIKVLMGKVVVLKSEQDDHKKKIEDYQNSIDSIQNGEYPEEILQIQETINQKLLEKKEDIGKINLICENIKSGDYSSTPELAENIQKGLKIKAISDEKILEYRTSINDTNQILKELETQKSSIQSKIYSIEEDKNQVKMYETLSQENKELKLKIENIKLTIENTKSKIEKYNNQLIYIQENEKVEEKIRELDTQISALNEKRNEFSEEMNEILTQTGIIKKEIQDLNDKIKKYKEQAKQDELLKEYMKCVHRDGIPSYLLQKSKELINAELGNLLNNVDFSVYFDESLNLKLAMNNAPGIEQNLLESSGKERTFGAIALKMALRMINNKSKPNFIFFDEVMTKLVDNSVDEFIEMLENAKKIIDKIIIIEHIHPIPYDALIEVTKDNKGVSSLKIE